MIEILKLLENDSTLSHTQIAAMLHIDENDVSSAIADYEKQGVILGYKAKIDWEKTERETVTALIDVQVTPQRSEGFDRVAERIYQYDEVESLYLMSGSYDFSILITGRTFKEVALFVAEKLAPLESVTNTATHFLLRKYKENNVVFQQSTEGQERIGAFEF